MKVLLCSPKGNTGGIAKWTSHILDYYSQNVHDVDMKWCYAAPSKREMIDTTPLLIRLYYGLANYVPFLKALRKELKTEKYDVVHFVSSAHISLIRDILTLWICRSRKAPAVVHFRFGRIPELFKQKNWEYRLLVKVMRKSSKVVVIDKKSYDTLIDNGYKNIYLLPNPVAPKLATIIELHKDITRKPRTLLFAGHCIPTKGVFELVDACKEIQDIHLRIIGICDDAMRDELYRRAGEKAKDWMEIMGNQPYEEVIRQMLSCAIFVLPTYTEGFPNVIIESMACACPIVTTPVGAIPEMLDIYGENPYGITVPVQDAVALKKEIEKLLSDESFAIGMGKRAQQRVNKKYSMPAVWQKLMEIWNS
ncbi:MAG: glycosyltransferase family 4 protein [Bacteroidaceae bacterium]|nr:glycosyltransferase family 4 protein [Bacteroidaceae bacterium]